MAELEVAHTSALGPGVIDRIRELLYDTFDDMAEDDLEHALGGMHALAWEGGVLLGHGSVVMRRLLHNGSALRAGYVEGVAVREESRVQGHGARIMSALEGIIASAYELGALGSTDEAAPFYAARGWRPWRGTLWALTPGGRARTAEEEGWVYVYSAYPGAAPLTLDAELTCGWRDGDVW